MLSNQYQNCRQVEGQLMKFTELSTASDSFLKSPGSGMTDWPLIPCIKVHENAQNGVIPAPNGAGRIRVL